MNRHNRLNKVVTYQVLISHCILKSFVFFFIEVIAYLYLSAKLVFSKKKKGSLLGQKYFFDSAWDAYQTLFCSARDAYHESWHNGTCFGRILFMSLKGGRRHLFSKKRSF